MRTAQGAITRDKVAAIKAEYVRLGGMRSNARYGYVYGKQAGSRFPTPACFGLATAPAGARAI